MDPTPGTSPVEEGRRGVLDPVSRVSEILYGVIMALTFTATLRVVQPERDAVRTMLVGAIGCNVAWGIVDAVMFLVTRLTEGGRAARALRFVRGTADTERAQRIIAASMPPMVASNLPEGTLEAVRERLKEETPRRPRLSASDFAGAVGVFLLVVVATLPVAAPFMVMSDVAGAVRVSNGIAVAMMFGCGYSLGRYAEYRPWATGVAMAFVGCVLVALTIALGG